MNKILRLYTIGTSKKNAEEFFTLLLRSNVELLLDIRLNNTSQLLGFSKKQDLKYFCEKCHGIKYEHIPLFAPTKELLEEYRKKKDWAVYEKKFRRLLEDRPVIETFLKVSRNFKTICLLCSEPSPDRCHRRLVVEYIALQNI